MIILGWILFLGGTIILTIDKTDIDTPEWCRIDILLLILRLIFAGHVKTILAVSMIIAGMCMVWAFR